ncbi:MAG: response regulator [Chloroflexi bacterium]|nr:response regulator [Chloroflexota bacterium]
MAAERVVLVVEDEEPNRALLRAVLARASEGSLGRIVLLEAVDLAGARQILANRRVDLVLLDVRLPDGNGLSLIPNQGDRTDETPSFVVLSASVLPTERAVAIAAGAADFLGKPYRPSDLLVAMAAQLPAVD